MSAKLTRRQLTAILADIIDAGKNQATLARDIANWLVREQQTTDLDALMRAVMAERQRRGTIEADVASAYPLQPAVRRQLEKLLHHTYPRAKKVVINNRAEPGLLSGLRLQTVDRQLDTTARTKLTHLGV